MPKKVQRVEAANALDLATYRERFLDSFLDEAAQQLLRESRLGLEFTSASQLAAQEDTVGRASSDIEACFQLVKASSQADYQNSSVRWSAAEKRKEMRLPDMRYLIVRRHGRPRASSSGDVMEKSDGGCGKMGEEIDENRVDDAAATAEVCGFISFMITYEDGFEVVYIYEIHIADGMRGKGLGAKLMRVVEGVALKAEMTKVMLTVFVSNKAAHGFYRTLGYETDDFSPRPRKLRNGIVKEPDYQILSKAVKPSSDGKQVKKVKKDVPG